MNAPHRLNRASVSLAGLLALTASMTGCNCLTTFSSRTEAPPSTVRITETVTQTVTQVITKTETRVTTAAPTSRAAVLPTASFGGTLASVPYGLSLTLDGSSSMAGSTGAIIRYEWTWLSGGGGASNMTLNMPVVTNSSSWRVVMDPARRLALGPQVFRLVVQDEMGINSNPVNFTVNITAALPPKASLVVTPPSVASGVSFILDGSASTPGSTGIITRYIWTWISGGGSTANMALNTQVETVSSTFSVAMDASHRLAPGPQVFQLQVVDDLGNLSGRITFTVNVTGP